jgi:hypothetical protein
MDDPLDPVLARARDALRPLPPVAPSLVARVLAATVDAPPRPWWARLADALAVPRLSLAAGGALALLALVAGVAVTARLRAPAPAAVASAPATSAAPAVPAAAVPGRVAVQFVLDAPAAAHVSVVGDFNEWNGDAAPLARAAAGQPWAAVLFLPPGRHVYAFLVDGAVRPDPRAPRAPDDDFGKPGSVLVVPTP